jgi:type IV secretory pathway VirB2 component (pilin)
MSLSDPYPQSSALVAAVMWARDVALGSLATAVAIIAVATIGYGMLTGRVNFRRGATVLAGCFILFGAATIAEGLRYASDGAELASVPTAIRPLPPPVIPAPQPARPPQPYDPYAGASVPSR